jgi:Ca2+-transporting ATPase
MHDLASSHSVSVAEAIQVLDTDKADGLSGAEASVRLQKFGPNALGRVEPVKVWAVLVRQFRSAVVLLLAVAAGLSAAFGDFIEAVAVVVVIAINALIGFLTELSAVRSMEALHRLGTVSARVRRDGALMEIDAAELVPGDIVELEAGDLVAADLRLVSAHKLACDESALTGESAQVSKHTAALSSETLLADRTNMAYKGTPVTRGSGAGVVVGTGIRTELGAITKLVAEAKDEQTPLEKQLDALGRHLVWVILIIAAGVAVLGIARGKEIVQMVETGIALAVASLPEGLPIVATIALSRGLLRMARRQALVRRLSAVETLGSASVIFSDKTGTLTENRMTVTRFDSDAGGAVRLENGSWRADETARDVLDEALRVAVLCNNASISAEAGERWKTIGDPLEGALLLAAVEHERDPFECRRTFPEVREEPFSSETKLMATFHGIGEDAAGPLYVAVKGAPEAVLPICSQAMGGDGTRPMDESARQRWLARNNEIASDGTRMLALAFKQVADEDARPYGDLTFVCLVGMADPPRADVRASIEACTSAGIRVIMITGDHSETARYVARAVGITSEDNAPVVTGRDLRPLGAMSAKEAKALRGVNIFARVSPQQKLDLIALHQAAGQIVAMTGDGVNDAPALKKADIGVAMGIRGTQVAREVADVVLKDDAFHSIVVAIQEGRIIFGNIRKFVIYLLSCNIAEILVILIASLLNAPLPILPLQILFLNLVTDVFPALALGMGEGDASVMRRRPRPSGEALLPRRYWMAIVVYAGYIGAATLAVSFLAHGPLRASHEASVTMSFMTIAVAQVLHVFNMRDAGAPLLRNAVTRNPYVWGAIALCGAMLAAAVYAPELQRVLRTAGLSWAQWGVVIGFSAVPVALDTLVRAIRRAARGATAGRK